MNFFVSTDKCHIAYQKNGRGAGLVFCHEFAGNINSWYSQMSYFGKRYQCVAWAARGYPPSSIPEEDRLYSQDQSVKDLEAVIDDCKFETVRLVGLSMGAYTALNYALLCPNRVEALVIAGCGYGSRKGTTELFRQKAAEQSREFMNGEFSDVVDKYALAPGRIEFRNKDKSGWERFVSLMKDNNNIGLALTLKNVQGKRASLRDLASSIEELDVPTLIISGDRDIPCLEAGVFLLKKLPDSRLLIVPNSGHTINMEEPELFNYAVDRFFSSADCGGRRGEKPSTSLKDPLGV